MTVRTRFLADTTTLTEGVIWQGQSQNAGSSPEASTEEDGMLGQPHCSIKLIQSLMSLVDIGSACLVLQRMSMSPFSWYKVKQNLKRNFPSGPGPDIVALL